MIIKQNSFCKLFSNALNKIYEIVLIYMNAEYYLVIVKLLMDKITDCINSDIN